VQFSVADAKRAGLWGKSGPWTQYPRRMLQLRARGFALRDAFPDVLKGLVTAEEAQDYPQASPPAEAPAPAPRIEQKPVANDDRMGKARLAINAAKNTQQLNQIVTAIYERQAENVFTSANVDELLALADGKAELLRGDAYEGDTDAAE
jgi:hypothetical protein